MQIFSKRSTAIIILNVGSLGNLPKRWKTLNRRDLYCYGKGSIHLKKKVVETHVST